MTRDGTNGEATYSTRKAVNYIHVYVLEFQDGSRKEPTQDCHGSGRVHLHLLGFADEPALSEIPWGSIISANFPETDDQPVRGYVEGSQLDRNGDSGCPIFNGNSG